MKNSDTPLEWRRAIRRVRRRTHCARKTRHLLYLLYSRFGLEGPATGAEVGVERGHNAAGLLVAWPALHLVAIDHWREFDGHPARQRERDRDLIITLSTLSENRDRVELLVMPSILAAQQLSDDSLDFVYIDADHRYEGVIQDIHAYWPKIRDGGLLCGDDYLALDDVTGDWGVSRAVDEFSQRSELEATVDGKLWWISKGPADAEQRTGSPADDSIAAPQPGDDSGGGGGPRLRVADLR